MYQIRLSDLFMGHCPRVFSKLQFAGQGVEEPQGKQPKMTPCRQKSGASPRAIVLRGGRKASICSNPWPLKMQRRAWATSVFIKQLMAVSGLRFRFFLLFHSCSASRCSWARRFTTTTHWLHEEAFVPILPADSSEFSAAVALMLIILCSAAHRKRSRRARSTRYVVKSPSRTPYAAHHAYERCLILILIFHITSPL